MSEESILLGREKVHYSALELLNNFSNGEKVDLKELVDKLETTIGDLDTLSSGNGKLIEITKEYLGLIKKGNVIAAKLVYLLLSPILFYIHALYEVTKKNWRNVVIASGIFCERIINNSLKQYDKKYTTTVYETVKDAKFDSKNGRLKAELEKVGFERADDFFSILKLIYSVRNTKGPHDVPPPEDIQAMITVSQCLPAYLDYLNALSHMGINFSTHREEFILYFNGLTETKSALIFDEDREKISSIEAIQNLYKIGYFHEERSLSEIQEELHRKRFNFTPQALSHSLDKLRQGREAIITRAGKRGSYKYIERIPPN